jgi:urocanate hydratase
VFQNWAQYLLTMQYLAEMTEEPNTCNVLRASDGLVPSVTRSAPRVVVTNGMMIPNYSKKEDWNKYNALGVTQYGQMTAGSYMYIGPQGIVHGTTITLLNAGRKLGLGEDDLRGKVYVTSGLGGMSGAQAGAAVITGCVGVIAEVDGDAVQQRVTDGYILRENVFTDLDQLIDRMEECRRNRSRHCAWCTTAILWTCGNTLPQTTSKWNWAPTRPRCTTSTTWATARQGYTFEQAKELLMSDKPRSWRPSATPCAATWRPSTRWPNAACIFGITAMRFLLEAGHAGADVLKNQARGRFRYPRM